MIIVSVKVTKIVKAGNLDLQLSDTREFYFADDNAATQFGLDINSDPECKLVGWKTVLPVSYNGALAKLQVFKESVANM